MYPFVSRLRNAYIFVGLQFMLTWAHAYAQSIPTEITVTARVNTSAVVGDADDPAIWIHPTDPALSLIIGTDKAADSVHVWDMNGVKRQRIPIAEHPNNGDVRSGMLVGGTPVDIYVVGAEDNSRVIVFKIDPDTRTLSDITTPGGILTPQVKEPYGVCLYRRASDGAMYVFVNSNGGVDGVLNQYQLLDDGAGRVRGVFVRSIGGDVNGNHSEGMVADDELGYVYISEEDCCVHKFHADPSKGNSRLAVFAQGDGIDPDREGLGIYGCSDGTGYILLSSQGNRRVMVYRREGDPGNPHSHTLVTTIHTPDIGGTDGLEVTNQAAGPTFPFGFLAKHNSGDKNFGLIAWEDIAQTYLRICAESPTPCEVTAGFSADVTSGCGALTVNFSDASAGPVTSWSWDFGDGATSVEQNPAHAYAAAGIYQVKLTVSSESCSDVETKPNYVTVNEVPSAEFSGSPVSGNAPVTVDFTDQSTGAPASWQWDFGDGGSSTLQNPSHTYDAAGDYTVALMVSNACGSTSTSKVNYIHVDPCAPPSANFTGAPTSGSVPLSVNFTDQSTGNPGSWSWDFGDGGSSNLQNPSHQYTAAGTWTVSLTASNACGADTETKASYITVSSAPANVALDKPATASSTNGSNAPGRAVDGSTSTYWRSGSLNSNTVAWLRVDLQSAYTINRVVMRWRSSYYARTYQVQYSNDNVNWSSVFSTTSGNGGNDDISFTAASGRYWRVYMTRNRTSSERINEFEIYTGSAAAPEASSKPVEIAGVPSDFELSQNFPNPFNPSTRITFHLPHEQLVTLRVFNLIGKEVATLVNEVRAAGVHSVTFTADNLPSGFYFCILEAGDFRQVRRLVFMK